MSDLNNSLNHTRNKDVPSKLKSKRLKTIAIVTSVLLLFIIVTCVVALVGFDRIQLFFHEFVVKYYYLLPFIQRKIGEVWEKILSVIALQQITNREVATLLWLGIGILILPFNKCLCEKFIDFLKILFSRIFIVLFTSICIYTIIIIMLLSKVHLWDVSLLKDTVIWIVFFAFITCINYDRKKEKYFKTTLMDNLKIVVLLEFLINAFSFSLLAEFIILPIILVVFLCSSFAQNMPEHKQAKTLMDFLQAVFGIALLTNAIWGFIISFKITSFYNTVISFLLTPLLSFLFIPFIYMFAVYIVYDSIETSFKMGRQKDKYDIKSYMRKIFITLNINLKNLNGFLLENTGHLKKVKDKEELNRLLVSFKNKLKKKNEESEFLANEPYRDLIMDEIGKGNISSFDIEVYLYMQERFKYYESHDGIYIISKHDKLVTQEASRQFNIPEKEIDRLHYVIGNLMVGIKPKERIKLDEKSIPVEIIIEKVEISGRRELVIIATNNTCLESSLPTINMSFQLFNGDKYVASQVIWAENFERGTSHFKSLPVSYIFDSVNCTAYINIDKMKSSNLKSIIQLSNEKGETVIPVYFMPKTKIYKMKVNDQKN